MIFCSYSDWSWPLTDNSKLGAIFFFVLVDFSGKSLVGRQECFVSMPFAFALLASSISKDVYFFFFFFKRKSHRLLNLICLLLLFNRFLTFFNCVWPSALVKRHCSLYCILCILMFGGEITGQINFANSVFFFFFFFFNLKQGCYWQFRVLFSYSCQGNLPTKLLSRWKQVVLKIFCFHVKKE